MNSKPRPSVWKQAFFEITPYIVVLILLTMTFFAWDYVRAKVFQRSQDDFHSQFDQTVMHLTEHLRQVQILINGAQGFLAASDGIDRTRWHEYVKHIDLQGIRFLAFIQKVPFEKKQEYLQLKVQEGLLGAGIFPPGDREIYMPVAYVEPETKSNEKMMGYDMFADSNRRTSMEYARDEGLPAITGGIAVEEGGPGARAETQIIAFFPVYIKGGDASNPGVRRETFYGFVSAGLMVDQLMNRYPSGKDAMDIRIIDGDDPDSKTIFESLSQGDDTRLTGQWIQAEERVEVFNRAWIVRARRFVPADQSGILTFVWAGGVCVSLLVFGLLRTLLSINHRANRIADAMSRDLKDANLKLKTILDTAPLGIFLSNTQGEYTYVNRAFQKIVERSMEECLGGGWASSLHPDDHDPVHRAWDDSVAYIKKFSSQHRFLKPGGEIVIVRVEAVEMRENLQFVGHVGIVQDITYFIQGQEALRRSEENSNKALMELKRLQQDEHQQSLMIARMNNLMVDREIVMVELKNQIKELKARLAK